MSTQAEAILACAAGALLAAVLLAWGIRSLSRLEVGAEIAVLPVLGEQPVFLSEAGDVVLALRTRQFSTVFGGVSFAMRSAGGSIPVRGRPLVLRARRVDLCGDVTLSVHRFTVPQPGEYLLSAVDLRPGADYAQARLVLLRPAGFAVALHVVWVLAAAFSLVGMLVLAAVRLIGENGSG